MRVYVPATVRMLRQLVADSELRAVNGTAFAITPALREAYSSGDDDELGEVAMAEAARASLRLLASEHAEDEGPFDADSAPIRRRAVIAADVDDVKLRPDLDDAVVRLSAPITMAQVASAHVDLAEAEPTVQKAIEVVDQADLGDTDAEFVVGDAEDHELAWYATQELPFLLELL
ncbi:hypothetical protein JGU71_05830 [Antrihabitans sp. YC3-6]|uniref:Uncharacterized protein n=1 Tax=Antrihabitans stalagmiti TaxID=2799499 RepID=A0A934NNE3_9NOCA|nr:hypothetical protein [Antrihabitans stalagmiti]MBJ8338394.1 hypothetical protein [Antrihabitans stalagmiti]